MDTKFNNNKNKKKIIFDNNYVYTLERNEENQLTNKPLNQEKNNMDDIKLLDRKKETMYTKPLIQEKNNIDVAYFNKQKDKKILKNEKKIENTFDLSNEKSYNDEFDIVDINEFNEINSKKKIKNENYNIKVNSIINDNEASFSEEDMELIRNNKLIKKYKNREEKFNIIDKVVKGQINKFQNKAEELNKQKFNNNNIEFINDDSIDNDLFIENFEELNEELINIEFIKEHKILDKEIITNDDLIKVKKIVKEQKNKLVKFDDVEIDFIQKKLKEITELSKTLRNSTVSLYDFNLQKNKFKLIFDIFKNQIEKKKKKLTELNEKEIIIERTRLKMLAKKRLFDKIVDLVLNFIPNLNMINKIKEYSANNEFHFDKINRYLIAHNIITGKRGSTDRIKSEEELFFDRLFILLFKFKHEYQYLNQYDINKTNSACAFLEITNENLIIYNENLLDNHYKILNELIIDGYENNDNIKNKLDDYNKDKFNTLKIHKYLKQEELNKKKKEKEQIEERFSRSKEKSSKRQLKNKEKKK
jgi:small-conductance mechanosensitive channel